MPKDAYEGSGQAGAQRPDPGMEAPAAAYIVPDDDADYEALFMRDAMSQARDIELGALAAMALIRSTDHRAGRRMLMSMESESSINPRVINSELLGGEGSPREKK